MTSQKTTRPFWFLLLAVLCFLGASISLALHFFKDDPTKIAVDQLSALRNKKITEAYYAYTSEGFQSQTPLETFQEFLKEHPIFLNHTSAKVKDKFIENDMGTVLMTFYVNSVQDEEVIFNIVKENNAWKILGIEVLNSDNSQTATMTGDLIEPVETQLMALQRHDVLGAYKDLVSKQFQANNPFDKFKAYIIQNAILTQFKNFDFKEHYIEGNQGLVTVVLNPDDESILVKYKLVKENDAWKIELMKVVQPLSKRADKAHNSSEMISVIKEMLADFKKKDYEKAYENYIDDSIKKDTPYDAFKKFVKNYPAFSNHQSMNVKEPLIEGNVGHLVVDLSGSEGITSVEFTLKLVNNEWKIEGMHISKVPVITETSSNTDGKKFKTRELLGIIQAFLKAIHAKEDEKAYKQYTSQNFKFTNTFQDFQTFLKSHPELISTTSSSFEKLMFNNNVATFGGKLYISDKFYLPIEFDLIQEDDRWKILNIFTYPPSEIKRENKNEEEGAESIPLEFTKVALGTSIDEEGYVENPATTFHTTSGDINMNLFINHGVAGTKLEITLRHVESGSEIAPVKAVLNDNGETELSFVFSPPPHGWPKGSYQIRISSSTKVYKTFTFTVE